MIPERVLIIQTAFIGDVVLTSPLVKAVKTTWPAVKTDILVVPRSKNVLENNPNLFKIINYDKRGNDKGIFRFFRLANRLRKNRYDLVLLPHRSIRSAFLAVLTGAKKRFGFSKGFRYLYTHTVKYNPDIHEVERNLKLLEPLGIEISGISPEVYPDDKDEQAIRFLLPDAAWQQPVIAVAPGSVWATKRWPQHYYARLAESLAAKGMQVILIGGMEDFDLCERIIKNGPAQTINMAGKLSLLQSAALLKRCAALICNDSGTLHLGVAAGTRVIALFGPTVPAFGFYPYGKGHIVIEKELPCRPCAIHGGNTCPIGTHACMLEITPEAVLNTVLQVIS